jgi:hypothetical protein
MRALIFALLLTACGTEEDQPDQTPPAMCKTLQDGAVHRAEIEPDAIEMRETMKEMGFTPCP